MADWKCPRARYYGFEWQGRGLRAQAGSLALTNGIIIHDALAAIAATAKDNLALSIDDIAVTAYKQAFEAIVGAQDETPDLVAFASEQASLIEGLIRGFHKHVWPRLLVSWPHILQIEGEMEFSLAPDLLFMAKPDLLLGNDSGEVLYVEYKSTSSKKDQWVTSWDTAVQLHSSIRAVEATMGKAPDAVQIVGLYKGYECLSPETPILTTDLNWVPVGDLNIGDTVAGFEEYPSLHKSGRKNKRQWKTATVTHVGRKVLPSYKVTASDGTSIIASENHLWLTARTNAGTGSATWTATKNLRKGTKLLKVVDTWEKQRAFENGYLAAAFDGEGNLSQHNTKDGYWLSHLAFTQKDNEMLEAVCGYLDDLAFSYGENNHRGNKKVGGLYIHGQAQVMKFLGTVRPKRLLPKFCFDKLGGMTVLGNPLDIVSIEFLGDQEVVTIGTSTETLIANGIASHNSYGKQSSPFCYAYKKSGNPPFTTDTIAYDYKPGFKRYPTWELSGGLKKWVDDMPENILATQFPMTAPIFINDDLVDKFFRQQAAREADITFAGMRIAQGNENLDDILDEVYPQHFDQCAPPYGFGCDFKTLCHSYVSDPLTSGFDLREPHHARELEAFQNVQDT